MTGARFSNLLMFSNSNLADSSLLEMCQEFEHLFGEGLTKQALDERFNNKAVLFFKMLMELVLNCHLNSDIYKNLLPNCKTIRIKDATSFQLPESMSEKYPGSGGDGSKACVKIQFEYDLRSGKIYDLSIGPFTVNDLTNSKNTLNSVRKGDFLIRDMGFIDNEFMAALQRMGAFYLNRIKSDVSVWLKTIDNNFEKLDLGTVEKQMRHLGIDKKEYEVCLGAKKNVKCRLVLICLPEKIKAEKLRKAKRAAQRTGRQLSKETIARMGLNVFVTNLPAEELAIGLVWDLYRLRWQIELVFKAWKSVAAINKIKKTKRERIECYLYAKLVFVLLGWNIFWKIMDCVDKSAPLSFYKLLKNLKRFCPNLIRTTKVSLKGPGGSEFFLSSVMSNCRLEKRKGHLSSVDIIYRLLSI